MIGDFESDLDGWELAPALFPAAPSVVVRSVRKSRVGKASLEVTCRAVRGCGSWVRIFYPFRKGVQYVVTGDVNLPNARNAVSLQVGVPSDHVESYGVEAPGRWAHIKAKWIPSRNEPFAEIALITTRPSRVRFFIDGLTLSDTSAAASLPPTPERGGKPFVYYAGAATPTRPRTLTAVGAGALIGLLVTVGALVCGHFALRAEESRRQTDE